MINSGFKIAFAKNVSEVNVEMMKPFNENQYKPGPLIHNLAFSVGI